MKRFFVRYFENQTDIILKDIVQLDWIKKEGYAEEIENWLSIYPKGKVDLVFLE